MERSEAEIERDRERELLASEEARRPASGGRFRAPKRGGGGGGTSEGGGGRGGGLHRQINTRYFNGWEMRVLLRGFCSLPYD